MSGHWPLTAELNSPDKRHKRVIDKWSAKRCGAHSKQKPPFVFWATCLTWCDSCIRGTRTHRTHSVSAPLGLISHRECVTMLKLINQGNVSIIPHIICRRLIALRSSTREASFNRSEHKKRLTESVEKNLKRVPHWWAPPHIMIIKQYRLGFWLAMISLVLRCLSKNRP